MSKGVSLYLDLVRFTAAIVVFFGHVARQTFTDGFLWQAATYMDTAVIVFFVLSGYVIAHVLDEKERTPSAYVIARVSRLYSVVVPALIVTAVCDGIGIAVDPALYYGPAEYASDEVSVRYLATLFFANQFWIWNHGMEAGTNVPFWSLSFEVTYYIAIGLLVFTKGAVRVVLCGLLAALVGPTIVAFAPIWFLGFGLYHGLRGIQLARMSAMALALTGLLLLFCAPLVRGATATVWPLGGHNLIASYYDALGFALHLVGILSLSPLLVTLLGRSEALIRWLGSLTFALYLFHRPIFWLLSALHIGPPSSWSQRIYLCFVTLLVVMTIGWWCEMQKKPIRRWLTMLSGVRST